MKTRMLSVLCAISLAPLFFSGCDTAVSSDDRISVVTTVFPSYDFAREIAGEKADVSFLLTPGGESHSFEPTAADALSIQQCDVFVYIGGDSEHWVEEMLESLNTDSMQVIRLFDYVSPLEEETVEGMQSDEHSHEHDENCDHDAAEYDEHIWTSPENAILMTQAISDALIAADSENKEHYQASTNTYIERLTQLDENYRAIVDQATSRTVVFGDRFPFRYLFQAYGLEYYAAFPGCSSETEASAATLAFLIEKIQTEEIPFVLYTESATQKIAERICDATGADSAMLHSCNNITKEEQASGATYVSLMEQNLVVLAQALGVTLENAAPTT